MIDQSMFSARARAPPVAWQRKTAPKRVPGGGCTVWTPVHPKSTRHSLQLAVNTL